MPSAGNNGAAAVTSGACRREALAYRQLLPFSPIRFPSPYLVELADDGAANFVLEDLGAQRAVDQMEGLEPDDCLAATAALARFHRHWPQPAGYAKLNVRRAAPATIPLAALTEGLAALRERWSSVLDSTQLTAFEQLVKRRDRVIEAFVRAEPVTLCHGDPRADNMVFAADGIPILFDWQQVALQFGAADVAWLAATSLTSSVRRRLDSDLADTYGTSMDRYRLGFVLPGLAVLLLAQREVDDERTARFVATSLERIATALVDLDVARI